MNIIRYFSIILLFSVCSGVAFSMNPNRPKTPEAGQDNNECPGAPKKDQRYKIRLSDQDKRDIARHLEFNDDDGDVGMNEKDFPTDSDENSDDEL